MYKRQLYGIRSERRLEEEVNYNMAYKWFCGLSLTEKAPDATTPVSYTHLIRHRSAGAGHDADGRLLPGEQLRRLHPPRAGEGRAFADVYKRQGTPCLRSLFAGLSR